MKSDLQSTELGGVDGGTVGPKFNSPCAELFNAFIKLDFHAIYGNAVVLSPDATDVTDNGGEKEEARNADADKNESDDVGTGGLHRSELCELKPNSS